MPVACIYTYKFLALMNIVIWFRCVTVMCTVYRQSLAKKQEELRGYEMQINNATKGVDLDSSLASIQGKLQTHQEYVPSRYGAFLRTDF